MSEERSAGTRAKDDRTSAGDAQEFSTSMRRSVGGDLVDQDFCLRVVGGGGDWIADHNRDYRPEVRLFLMHRPDVPWQRRLVRQG